MIPAGADYLSKEALQIGAIPVIRATLLPYLWPDGIDAAGSFVDCAYVSPNRIQANYEGFTGGSWISSILTANLQISSSSAVITWAWNSPGFDLVLYWRGAMSTSALVAASWVLVTNGNTPQIQPYYQFKLTIDGYRSWAIDSSGDADNFTAWAEDSPGNLDSYQGYAADTNVPGDLLTYIETLNLLGELTIVRDIEQAGTVTVEAPKAFDDLVAGSHSGLILNNRQVDSISGFPAPSYSPNKSSFIFAGKNWFGTQLRMELGWLKGASFSLNAAGTGYAPGQTLTVVQSEASFMTLRVLTITGGGGTGPVGTAEILTQGRGYYPATGLLTTVNTGSGTGCKINLLTVGDFTDFIILFLGKITKWGPISRAVDQTGVAQANTVEIYAKDWMTDCLQKRVALPALDGTPEPLTFGEFLCKADAVSGWSPVPAIRTAYFENDNYNELDRIVVLGGGSCSLITPGLTGTRAIQFQTTAGGIQTVYGSIILPYAGEMFITGSIRFSTIPTTIANLNMTFMQVIDSTGAADFAIQIDNTGNIWGSNIGQTKFNILSYLDIPLSFAIWLCPTNPGYVKVWINEAEILTYQGNISGDHPLEFRFGVQTSSSPEAWVINFDDIEVRPKYYDNAFKVDGGPFESIGPVYLDNYPQPDTQTIINNSQNYTQTLTRLPEYGMVQFISTDPTFKPSGTIEFRVAEHTGGRHALDIIQSLLSVAGLTNYIDATSLASAYATSPDDVINARFEGGKKDKNSFGLKEIVNLGITVADCLKEICSRMLYWIFIDAGKIKIVPYTGIPPSSPIMALTVSNLYEAMQIIDLDQLNDFVSATYGWYEHSPSLFVLVGNQTAGGQGTCLDFTWGSPVSSENRDLALAKTTLLLKFLSAQERLEPVRTSLSGARLELMEVVSVRDELLNDEAINYWITRKEPGLDPGSRETTLQLMRFLGE